MGLLRRRSPNFWGCNWPTSARTDRFANDQHHPHRPHPTTTHSSVIPAQAGIQTNSSRAGREDRVIPAQAGIQKQPPSPPQLFTRKSSPSDPLDSHLRGNDGAVIISFLSCLHGSESTPRR